MHANKRNSSRFLQDLSGKHHIVSTQVPADSTSNMKDIKKSPNYNEDAYISKHFPMMKVVKVFQEGDGFGEIALQTKQRRYAVPGGVGSVLSIWEENK